MTYERDTQYKISRNNAGLTQEEAAERLSEKTGRPLATRTLSGYENGHDKVPDDVVEAMAEVYSCPILVYLHVASNPHFAKYFPEIQKPQTYGDMTLLMWNAADLLNKTIPEIMRLQYAENPKGLKALLEVSEQARAMLVSANLYTRGLIDEKACCN